MFAIAFKKPVLAWNMQGWKEAKTCTGVYADDIIKKHLVKSGRAEEAMQIVSEQSKRLTEHLQRSKLKQNQDKKELVLFLGNRREMRELQEKLPREQGRVMARARHLGGRLSFNASNAVEITYRLQAMTKGWCEMGKFWSSVTKQL